MHSSTAVVGRALIMLACAVGIPALALSGSSWSAMLKKLQDFQWPAVLEFASASKTPAPRPMRPLQAPRMTAPPVAASVPAAPAGQTPFAEAPLPQPSVNAANSGIVPVDYQFPSPASASTAPISTTGEPATAANGSATESFRTVQERLRQLGATYCLLESWGKDQQLYRFYCKMAIAGSADYTRYFESTHGDPLQAMHEVLRQVESWRETGARKN